MSDFHELAKFGLRDLYLKMTKVYSESLKSESSANENLVIWFTKQIDGNSIDSAEAIEQFITQAETGGEGPPVSFTSNSEVNEFLSEQYAFYGIDLPPEGFLDIDAGTENWWDTAVTVQNGYFIQTHIFNIADIYAKPMKLKLGNEEKEWNNPESSLDPDIKNLLYDLTRERYLDDNLDSQLTEEDIIPSQDAYFLILDEEKNSLYFKVASATQSAKLYVRVFFNIYGQKLASSIVDITGISEVRKVPSGIRKNFLIKNFMASIKSAEKDFNENKKNLKNPKKREKLIQSLNQVKDLIAGIQKKKQLKANSRIGFIFNEEYNFLALVDGNNIPINDKPLKDFLRDNVKLNKLIASLNLFNCYYGATPAEDDPATSISQIEAKEYEHFVTDAPELSEKEKVSNFNIQKNKMEFVGDIGVKLVLDEMKKNSAEGAVIADLYNKFFNKIDYKKLAESAISLLAANMPALDFKKTNFESFINSLDITELIDCVVEQAGVLVVPPSKKQIKEAKDNEDDAPWPTVEVFFTEDLKLILYGGFAYFYNIAKQYDSKTFNYPTSDEPLQYAPDLDVTVKEKQEGIKNAEKDLTDAKNEVKKIDTQLANAEQELPDDIPEEPTNITELKEKQIDALVALLSAEEALEKAKLALLDAQIDRDKYINKYFPYILMIPEEQTDKIYDTITTNVPQYRNNQELIESGFSKIQFTSGFKPNKFVTFLLRKYIIDYANSLDEPVYNALYNNLAAANAKLKEANSEAESESGPDASDAAIINATATTNIQTLPSVPNFDWFGAREYTTDYSTYISMGLNKAWDKALGSILSSLINPIVGALGKISLGDLGILDKLDAGLQSLVGPNDLVEDALNSDGNGVNSSEELYDALNKKMKGDIEADKIKCVLKAISNEVDLSTQTKFLRHGIDPANSDSIIIQDIFSKCGMPPANLSTINEFFANLSDLINDNLLDAKINLMKQTIESYMDVCADNDEVYLENLMKFLNEDSANNQINNEKREAAAKLKELLGLLDNNHLDGLAPKIFCNEGSAAAPVFESMYSPVVLDSQNKLISDLIDSTNDTFNDEIGSYKSTILSNITLLRDKFNSIDIDFASATLVGYPDSSFRYYEFTISDDYVGLLILNGLETDVEIEKLNTNIIVDPESINLAIIDIKSELLVSNVKASDYYDLEKSLEDLFKDGPTSFFQYTGVQPQAASIVKILKDDFTKTFKQIYNVFVNRFVEGFKTFVSNFFLTDENIYRIPLKDDEYNDGGLLCSQEIYENYKLARNDLQCYVDAAARPDPHQISQLTALYEILINATAIEEILQFIFVISQVGSYDFEQFEKEQLSQTIALKIHLAFENSLTNTGNLQEGYENDLQLIYKYDLIKNKQSDMLKQLNEEGVSTRDIISHFLKKYYSLILDRLQQRTKLIIGDLNYNFTADKITSEEYPIYKDIDYDSVAEGEGYGQDFKFKRPSFRLTSESDLSPNGFGFIVQKFVDIRQQAVENTLSDELLPSLDSQWAWGPGGWAWQNPSSAKFYDYFILTPNTAISEWNQNVNYKKYTPTDGFKDTNDDIPGYKQHFLRTQGKITFEDFINFYYNPWDKNLKSGVTPYHNKNTILQLRELFKQHGPKQYFKKIAVGKRLSVVLPRGLDEPGSLTKELQDYYFNMVNPSQLDIDKPGLGISEWSSARMRYLLQEKLINYNYTRIGGQLERIIVIPLIEESFDVLNDIEEKWEDDSEYDWLFNMFSHVSALWTSPKLANLNVHEQAASVFKDAYFAGLLPYFLDSALKDVYGDQLDNVVSTVKNDVINSIHISKAVINEDWDSKVTSIPNTELTDKLAAQGKLKRERKQAQWLIANPDIAAEYNVTVPEFVPPMPLNWLLDTELDERREIWQSLVTYTGLKSAELLNTAAEAWAIHLLDTVPNWDTKSASERLKEFLWNKYQFDWTFEG